MLVDILNKTPRSIHQIIIETSNEFRKNDSFSDIYNQVFGLNSNVIKEEFPAFPGLNISSKNSEDSEDEILFDSHTENIYLKDDHPKENMNFLINLENKKKKIFEVIYPEKNDIFAPKNNFKSRSLKDAISENFCPNKRYRAKEKRKRGRNDDNLRIKFKRYFTNTVLYNSLNDKLDVYGYVNKLYKFPQSFAGDVTRKNNRNIMDKTIEEIVEMQELYGQNTTNYFHNLEIIKRLKQEKNPVPEFLKMKFWEILDNYVNSKKFDAHVESLEKFIDSDLKRYKYLAKNFIQHYSN